MAKGEVDPGSLADLQSYVTHIKLTHSIRRNLLLIKLLQASQKKGRPEEYVRLYDSLLQVSSGHVWLSSFHFIVELYVCVYAYVHVYVHSYTYINKYACTYVHACVCMLGVIHTHVCTYVCA